jgi:DNA-directed RNA polymerase subunit RPC12/RpoP
LPEEKAQVDAAIAWLEEKWGEERECPYCGNSQWAIGPPVQLSISSDPGITPPLFSASCTNCGNTVLITVMYEGIDLEGEE